MAKGRVDAKVETGNKEKQQEVTFGHSAEAIEEREKMREELIERVIDPIALLAGLLATAKEEEGKEPLNGHEMLNSVGYLLSLVIKGAHKEINRATYGLDIEKFKSFLLEAAEKKIDELLNSKEGKSEEGVQQTLNQGRKAQ